MSLEQQLLTQNTQILNQLGEIKDRIGNIEGQLNDGVGLITTVRKMEKRIERVEVVLPEYVKHDDCEKEREEINKNFKKISREQDAKKKDWRFKLMFIFYIVTAVAYCALAGVALGWIGG